MRVTAGVNKMVMEQMLNGRGINPSITKNMLMQANQSSFYQDSRRSLFYSAKTNKYTMVEA